MAISYSRDSVIDRQLPDLPSGYINAYEVTLGYGGAEEGGWWFDVSEPIASVKYFGPNAAKLAIETLEEMYVDEYEDLPEKSSTATDACNLVICAENHFAHYKPEHKPHYE